MRDTGLLFRRARNGYATGHGFFCSQRRKKGLEKKKAIRLDTRPDSCLRGPPLVLVKKINSDWKSVNETYRE